MNMFLNIRHVISLVVIAVFACTACNCLRAQPATIGTHVVPLTVAEAPDDDYAPSFRNVGFDWEFWFTRASVRGMAVDRKLLVMRRVGGVWLPPVVQEMPLNQPCDASATRQCMDGASVFAWCDTSRGVIVSNRADDKGRYHGNDLHAIARAGDGTWSVRRIVDAGVNLDAWDDTPALNDDGTVLYFASNRLGQDSGETDLYMCRRASDGEWGPPEKLTFCRYGVHEQTPCVGPDGWLYYAGDADGDFDIRRVELDADGIPVAGTDAAVNAPNVNRHGSDELTPCFSPGGGWLLFSSNRARKGRFDIYGVDAALAGNCIEVQVMERRSSGAVPATGYSVTMTDLFTNHAVTLATDSNGRVALPLLSDIEAGPLGEPPTRSFRVEAVGGAGTFVSSADIITIRTPQHCRRRHTLFVWDPSVLYDTTCRQDFAVQSIPFFVKGYWCPTTGEYSGYTPCQSVFKNPLCTVLPPEVANARPPCGDSDLYVYRLTPATLKEYQQGYCCISWRELHDNVQVWSGQVDGAIDGMVANMRSALAIGCVRDALARGDFITVTVQGWTDPDAIDRPCVYTGRTIVFDASLAPGTVVLGRHGPGRWLHGDSVLHGTPFRRSPPDGNPMLSALRAYYMAVLLDRLWIEQLPSYRAARDLHQVRLVADGLAVRKDIGPYELKRSIDVIVEAPTDVALLKALRERKPGAAYDLRCPGCR